jgi:hypothetical protein
MRRAGREVAERVRLHVDEGFFPRGMHDFEDKGSRIGSLQVEIIVVFAGERARRSFEAILAVGDARGVGRCERRSHASFGHHAGNCNGDMSR